jgi:CO/xanthine dehydrogenase FAD-binding subunit
VKDFEYFAPDSLEEALSILKKEGKKVKVLAGGTDLIVQMKDKRTQPAIVVNVKKIPELNRLELGLDNNLHIGAAVPLSKIVAFATVMQKFNILHQACSLIGSVQIRNRATMGGNICNAAPSADSAPPLLCLGAKAIVAHHKNNRVIPLESFFCGPGRTALSDNELLIEIEIPTPPVLSEGCYMRHTPREEMDIAAVSVAVLLVRTSQGKKCREARIALGAVAPTPVRVPQAESLLSGKVLNDEIIEEAAESAADTASPISDVRASAKYRRELVKVLTRRTLKEAWEALSKLK